MAVAFPDCFLSPLPEPIRPMTNPGKPLCVPPLGLEVITGHPDWLEGLWIFFEPARHILKFPFVIASESRPDLAASLYLCGL